MLVFHWSDQISVFYMIWMCVRSPSMHIPFHFEAALSHKPSPQFPCPFVQHHPIHIAYLSLHDMLRPPFSSTSTSSLGVAYYSSQSQSEDVSPSHLRAS